ncbi:P-loop ATPase, Sll1717 family [Geothermobacter hydrogeniphilus]|uniref:Uncharacterized protein n=1 Tax=Geothermobacter hydrogeniphilus TaxID=1969733 RepID=A0A1X0XPG4_9BACT|nr:hypothetical protein [Geothermobacter hydrogeniphilus]ORJ54771.1 hypothetical protein B5V00_15740 [Geothermobacter hydrogeniphilus]
MTRKLEALKKMEIGERVAEEESDHLERYFVETDQWHQMIDGKIDVVYGPKGSGKSALYTLLNKKDGELFDRGVLLASAENVRGATVFRTIVADPPPSELSFVYLWKIYSLSIIAKALREYKVTNEYSHSLIGALEKVGLLPAADSLSVLFRAVTRYFRGWLERDTKAIEYALTIDSTTGTPTFTRKTEFSEKSEEQNLGDIPVEELFEVANQALDKEDLNVWLLFDRLDVAFADSLELERNALRALFRAYNDIKAYDRVRLKIFVRDDIWQRITSGGFTEASHITKAVHIRWNEESLLNLVMLRLLSNEALVEYTGINPEEIKADYAKQEELFYRLAPRQVDTGKNPDTFNWILSRTTDSSGNSVPREVIHLLEITKEIQIKKLERGSDEPVDDQLFDRSSFKEALPTVSKVRFEQTLLAEYPNMRDFLVKLNGEKAEQTLGTLSGIWGTAEEKTRTIAQRLTEIGFFEARGSKDEPSYWVPFIYRSALNIVQGKADAP